MVHVFMYKCGGRMLDYKYMSVVVPCKGFWRPTYHKIFLEATKLESCVN
jgi:hypothetical protein